MRANRAAHERYAQAHYPVWTHPEMLRHLWAARSAYIDNPCEPTLDTLCHVNYNLWHTDFLETYEHAKAGILDLSDPFSGLRKVAESARGTLTTWQEIKDRNPTATVGRWVNGANVSVGVDEMIEDAMEDVATAEGQLAEALGEPLPAPARSPAGTVEVPRRRQWHRRACACCIREAMIVEARRGPTRLRERIREIVPRGSERNRAWDALVRELMDHWGVDAREARTPAARAVQELRELYARMPDIGLLRAERNRRWDALKAKEGQRR